VNTIKLEANINKAHAALAVAHRKANKGSSEKGKGGKGKGKKSGLTCSNCKLKGHTHDNCFAKGGGKEHEAPDWWKQKQEAKSKLKETKKETANAATSSSSKCNKNHAYITVGPTDLVPINNDRDFDSLIITSGHNHEAYGVSLSTDLIVDCGASHFSPDRFKFVNFEAILPEPIRAADGHTFSAICHGDLVVTLPVKNGENGPPITLKRVYYAPKMAFTLILVACLDKASCSLTIEDSEC